VKYLRSEFGGITLSTGVNSSTSACKGFTPFIPMPIRPAT